jgi:phosphoribosylamine--glycine ligase
MRCVKMSKKILVVGGGGREHAIIKALKKSPDCGEVWCAPGNGGIGYDAHCVNIKATDVETMVGFAETEKFDYVVVAQDDPLALGMVDALAAVGIPAFGPDKAAARIEASKVFSKDLMKKYGIPTAKYETFDDPAKVMEYIKAEGKYPVVIKADGLALGKGVLICENEEQAAEGVKEIMLDKKFGASGNHVVVEEFLTGPEVSVLSFTDGKVVKPMVSSMDHKRANDHDTGLNTGGMGTVAPNPYYTPAIAAECMEKIFLPTIKAMNAEGCPFKGCLYFGLMLTPDGPKVIEYNCRFGDPETQVVLPLLESDLLKVMTACTEGTLADTEVKFSDGAAACVILASGGYPVAYEKGKPITGLVDGQLPDEPNVTVYHSGTAITEDGQLVTNGGRVLGVTATAPGLPRAISIAYEAAEHIHFDKLHKRTDIGMRALKALAEKQ